MSRVTYILSHAVIAALCLGETLLADSITSAVASRMSDGSTIEGSSSVLVRSNDGVTGNFLTTATPGDAYTVWWVVFNEPENCSGGVCGEDDVLPPPGNIGAGVSVLYATGRVADVNGKAELGAALKVGDTTDVLFGPGLTDASNAEIHMVLRTHGPALHDALLQEQISSFDGGCPPNACVDEQFAIHRASDDRNAKALKEIQQRLKELRDGWVSHLELHRAAVGGELSISAYPIREGLGPATEQDKETSNMQADEFRTLCSRFATGVSIVTTNSKSAPDAAPVGMTVSSFTSVSLEPPLILVCLRNESRVTSCLVDVDYFGVNILQEDQHEISRQFAQRGLLNRFQRIDWHTGPYFVPVLNEVLAHLICATEGWLTRGDHTVLFGRVIDGSHAQQGHPLIHWASTYHRLLPPAAAAGSYQKNQTVSRISARHVSRTREAFSS